ncbi:hypothetical protein [Sinimarinibacterium flocculans]|uniref:hypothetical protein n=1 Tax=Sinimarinibacterium flocculans TaxID=985250 RepID=UPI002490DAE7|nr:hypothetical protein [Sinimarinibacterium flocculans]
MAAAIPEYASANEVNNLHKDLRAVRGEVTELKENVWLGFESVHKRMDAEKARPGTIERALNSKFTTALVVAVIGALGVVGASAYSYQKERLGEINATQQTQIQLNRDQCEFNNDLRQSRIDSLRRTLNVVIANPDLSKGKKAAAQDYYDRQLKLIPDALDCKLLNSIEGQ